MYHLLIPAVQGLLSATGRFGTVVCGTGSGAYPLANIVLRQSKPVQGKRIEETRLLVQVQSAAGDDSETSYLASLELLAVVKATLHGAMLPGHGARKLQVDGVETAQIKETGEMIYFVPIGVIVDPDEFTTT
nr:hypothetical protein [uncultured Desulfobulbus sp.]